MKAARLVRKRYAGVMRISGQATWRARAPSSGHAAPGNACSRPFPDTLREEGVETDVIRLADHQIGFGVVSEAISDGDGWPAIRERILASEILVMAIPTWLGQPSSGSKIALETPPAATWRASQSL